MHILANPGGQLINGYAGNNLNGYVGIGIFNPLGPGNLVSRPHSLLHLAEGVEGNASPWGYRDWQRNGITFTGNDDHGYIGHRYGEPDVTDMVLQWSDNPGFSRADRMRFIFTSEFTGAPDGMNSLEGSEGMYWM
ncbi:MAG: hypothetical protein WAR83_13665 [Flavobacteriales bacterium]